MTLQWSKTLSRTDAQQETTGYPVAYLRFTKSGHPENTQKWFREVFFGDATWTRGHFGQHPVEEAHVNFQISIQGHELGGRTMKVTHDYSRQDNNNTPNTWLHYDEATREELQKLDLSGHNVVIESDEKGNYSFSI